MFLSWKERQMKHLIFLLKNTRSQIAFNLYHLWLIFPPSGVVILTRTKPPQPPTPPPRADEYLLSFGSSPDIDTPTSSHGHLILFFFNDWQQDVSLCTAAHSYCSVLWKAKELSRIFSHESFHVCEDDKQVFSHNSFLVIQVASAPCFSILSSVSLSPLWLSFIFLLSLSLSLRVSL